MAEEAESAATLAGNRIIGTNGHLNFYLIFSRRKQSHSQSALSEPQTHADFNEPYLC